MRIKYCCAIMFVFLSLIMHAGEPVRPPPVDEFDKAILNGSDVVDEMCTRIVKSKVDLNPYIDSTLQAFNKSLNDPKSFSSTRFAQIAHALKQFGMPIRAAPLVRRCMCECSAFETDIPYSAALLLKRMGDVGAKEAKTVLEQYKPEWSQAAVAIAQQFNDRTDFVPLYALLLDKWGDNIQQRDAFLTSLRQFPIGIEPAVPVLLRYVNAETLKSNELSPLHTIVHGATDLSRFKKDILKIAEMHFDDYASDLGIALLMVDFTDTDIISALCRRALTHAAAEKGNIVRLLSIVGSQHANDYLISIAENTDLKSEASTRVNALRGLHASGVAIERLRPIIRSFITSNEISLQSAGAEIMLKARSADKELLDLISKTLKEKEIAKGEEFYLFQVWCNSALSMNPEQAAARTREVWQLFKKHRDSVNSYNFSPDGLFAMGLIQVPDQEIIQQILARLHEIGSKSRPSAKEQAEKTGSIGVLALWNVNRDEQLTELRDILDKVATDDAMIWLDLLGQGVLPLKNDLVRWSQTHKSYSVRLYSKILAGRLK